MENVPKAQLRGQHAAALAAHLKHSMRWKRFVGITAICLAATALPFAGLVAANLQRSEAHAREFAEEGLPWCHKTAGCSCKELDDEGFLRIQTCATPKQPTQSVTRAIRVRGENQVLNNRLYKQQLVRGSGWNTIEEAVHDPPAQRHFSVIHPQQRNPASGPPQEGEKGGR